MLGAQFQQPVDRVAESGELAAQPLPRTPGRQVPCRACGIPVDHECGHLVRAEAVEPGHPVDAVGEDEPVPEAGIQERFGHDECGSTHAQRAQVRLVGAEHLGPALRNGCHQRRRGRPRRPSRPASRRRRPARRRHHSIPGKPAPRSGPAPGRGPRRRARRGRRAPCRGAAGSGPSRRQAGRTGRNRGWTWGVQLHRHTRLPRRGRPPPRAAGRGRSAPPPPLPDRRSPSCSHRGAEPADFSRSSTSQPAKPSWRAATRPAMPAPTTTAFMPCLERSDRPG